MEIKELLLGREVCECGKSHKCPIDYVIISENAFDSIPEIIAEYNEPKSEGKETKNHVQNI